MRTFYPNGNAALLVAHPGHELLLYNWLATAHPLVLVLTDGSGKSNEDRIRSTKNLFVEMGLQPGPLFGRYPDHALYKAFLNHDYELFINLVHETANYFLEEEIDYLVCDSFEGYNPVHDISHVIAHAAVSLVNKSKKKVIELYDYPVVSRPLLFSQSSKSNTIFHEIDERSFRKKLEAARFFYPKLITQIEHALNASLDSRSIEAMGLSAFTDNLPNGLDEFRYECLRAIENGGFSFSAIENQPFYERYGEANVDAGNFDQVIRYHEHVKPVINALQEFTKSGY